MLLIEERKVLGLVNTDDKVPVTRLNFLVEERGDVLGGHKNWERTNNWKTHHLCFQTDICRSASKANMQGEVDYSASVRWPSVPYSADLLLFFSSLCPRSHRRIQRNTAYM